VTVTGTATVTLLRVLHHTISTSGSPALAAFVTWLVKQASPFVFMKEMVEVVSAAVAEATFLSNIFTHEAKVLIFTNAGRVVMPDPQVVPELMDHECCKQEDVFMVEGLHSCRKTT
jgi:hypothetical protein